MESPSKESGAPGASAHGNFNSILVEVLEDIQARQDSTPTAGLSTGIPDLDLRLRGMQPGELIVLGGRPGMGHEAISRRIALHVASDERRPVAFFSMSHRPELVVMELLSIAANIDPMRLSTGSLTDNDWRSVCDGLALLHQLPLEVISPNPTDLSEMLGSVREAYKKFEGKLGLIVIEGLESIMCAGTDKVSAYPVIDLLASLRNLGNELGAPVLLVSGLDPRLERRRDPRPRLGDLLGSGYIEQNADRVLLLYRHDHYYPESPPTLELRVAKNLYCLVGNISLDPKLGSYGQPFAEVSL